MESITQIATIIGIIVAIFSIPKTLHTIGDFRRKKFKDELDVFKEYFDNYHNLDNTPTPKLLKDKVAQNLTRSKDINYDLLRYFINLHEKNKANFDKLIEHYDWGNRFIILTKLDDDFHVQAKSYVSNLTININYLLYALTVVLSIFLFTGHLSFFESKFFNNSVGISTIILSLDFLRRAEDMREGLKFLKIIKSTASDNIDESI